MKIEKKYAYSEVNWILLPDLMEIFIGSIPKTEFMEGKDKKYEPRLLFEVHSVDEIIECHSKDEFFQITNSLKYKILRVKVAIECFYLSNSLNPYRSGPDYFQFNWSANDCAVVIERNFFSTASSFIKKFEETLQLKMFVVEEKNKNESISISKRKRSAFVAHSFDANGESYAFNLTKFLSHLNFEILTGAGYSPEKISNKVKRRLSEQEIVIAIISEKLDNTWLIQETTGAEFSKKPLFLCIEEGVNFSSGMLGDYEYIKFPKGNIAQAFIPILEGLRELGFSFK